MLDKMTLKDKLSPKMHNALIYNLVILTISIILIFGVSIYNFFQYNSLVNLGLVFLCLVLSTTIIVMYFSIRIKIRYINNQVNLRNKKVEKINKKLLQENEERIKAQDKLQDQIAFFQNLIDAMPNPIFYKNSESVYLGCNKAFCKLLKLSKDKIIGKHEAELFPEDMSEKFLNMDKELLKSGVDQLYEYDGTHYGSEVQHIICSKAAFKMNDTTIDTIVGVIFDITKQKNIEKALWESEEKYRMLLDFLPCPVMVQVNGNISFINQAGAKLLGSENPDNFVGKHMIEFIHESFKDEVASRIGQAPLLSKNTPVIEEKWITLDDKTVDVEVAVAKFSYSKEDTSLVVAQDITNKKVIEQALRESEERYRLLVELCPDAIVVHSDEKIIFANNAAAKLIGVSDPKELFDEDKNIQLIKDHKSLNRNYVGKDIIVEHTFTKADGRSVDVEMAIAEYLYKGKKSLLCVARDITERKQNEELKRKIDEKTRLLDEVTAYDKLRTEFFSNISHEVRTPLNLILGTLQLLELYIKDGVINDKDDKVSRKMRVIKQNCYRLLRLVNNLIDVTKIDSGFFEISLQSCDIVELIKDITLSVSEYVQNKGITLMFSCNIEEKITYCDPDKIERIMLNLLSNAVKFTKPGGDIIVSVNDNNEYVKISVKDTGIGISKEDQGKIFERFMQVDKSFSRMSEGSGIGLSIVKSLVEMHEGKIYIESECGKGSEFIIELPVRIINEDNNVKEINKGFNIENTWIEFSDVYAAK